MFPNSVLLIRWLKLSLVFSLFFSGATAMQAEETTNSMPLVVWDLSAEVAMAAGYRNNVLRSSIAKENSGFFLSAVDVSIMRFSESGSFFVLYLFGEDLRYFDAPTVDYEQLFSATAQMSTPIGVHNEVGLDVNYLYQHQILDASITEVDLQWVLVQGHSVDLRPHWKLLLGPDWEVQLEGAVLRQIFEYELDDYWQGAGRVSLTRNYGHKSELSIGYQPMLRFYDTRNQYDSSGDSVSGTDLTYWQNEADCEWRHNLNADRNWRTTSKLGYMASRDNGSGYFDYDRVLFRQQIRWMNDKWNIKATGRFGWYFYQQQDDDHQNQFSATLSFLIERRFGEDWKLYVGGEHEWSESNDPLDEYRSWMTSCGVGYEF